ncbi:MAG: ribonuclease J [Coriobacteriia bacterium]|nr:ribonuclease J [Coriobacteriia bacterium]
MKDKEVSYLQTGASVGARSRGATMQSNAKKELSQANRDGGQAANKKRQQNRRRPRPTELLRIIPLGGLDGIGKNMTVFEYKDDLIVVDAGLMFPDDGHPGVDLILPDYTYLLEKSHKIRGIVITHGHEDHTGALPYLLKDLEKKTPIYSSKLTLGLIDGKLSEFRIKNADLREVKTGQQLKLGEFTLEFFAVNHSIPAATGVFIRTPAGNVLHTGDFKLDLTPIDGIGTDYAAITRFAETGVDILLSDSTNAVNNSFTKSESEVGKVLRQIIKNTDQRVIVAAFSSHIHRIQQVCDAARASKRRVAVTGRSMLTNTQIARDLGYLDVPHDLIVDSYAAKDIPANRVVILCTGSQGEPLSALARMANSEHRTIEIEEGDVVIIAATPVPGNEKAVTRVVNALSKIGADVYDKHRALVHVSGHASAEELKLILAMSKPRNFMPVHGEALHLRSHAKLARSVGLSKESIFILENGESLLLDNNGIKRGETVESGIIYVDGLSVGDVSNVVLKDRRTLASDGIATVVVMLRKRDSKAAGEPEIIMRGVSGGDDPDLLAESVAIVSKTVAKFAHEHRNNPNRLQRAIRENLSKLLWERVRRRPMIIPIIMDV